MTPTQYAPLQVLHLRIEEDGETILLGYSLKLTRHETAILHCIAYFYPTEMKNDSIATLTGVNEASIPVHVNAINRKANEISGRKLIISRKKKGYTLNRFM